MVQSWSSGWNAPVFFVHSLCLFIPWPNHHHWEPCSQRWALVDAMPYMPSAICLVQCKLGFTVLHLPSLVPQWWTKSTKMSFHKMFYDSCCRNSLVVQINCCISFVTGLSDDLGGVEARCGGPGHKVCSCEPGWMHFQILKAISEMACFCEINIKFNWCTSLQLACQVHTLSKPIVSTFLEVPVCVSSDKPHRHVFLNQCVQHSYHQT